MDNQGKQVELLNLLLQENLVSINNLSEIKSLSEQGGKSIEDIIFEKNLVDPEEYIKVKSRVNLQFFFFRQKINRFNRLKIIRIRYADFNFAAALVKADDFIIFRHLGRNYD